LFRILNFPNFEFLQFLKKQKRNRKEKTANKRIARKNTWATGRACWLSKRAGPIMPNRPALNMIPRGGSNPNRPALVFLPSPSPAGRKQRSGGGGGELTQEEVALSYCYGRGGFSWYRVFDSEGSRRGVGKEI
jgi:hypothetical protein